MKPTPETQNDLAEPLRSMSRKIEIWPIERIVVYKKNPRHHSDAQVASIVASIRKFGFINPMLLQGEGANARIVAGHGRLKAAGILGLRELPVILLDHLTEQEARAYRIADNQTALMSEWDTELLRGELDSLERVDFDLETLAFDEEDLAAFLSPSRLPKPKEPDAEAVPEVPAEICSIRGDIWLLGKHRLAVADCLDRPAVSALMGGLKTDLVFTDPPYNVDYTGYTDEAMQIEGDAMSEADFKKFLREVFRAYRLIMKNTASIYVCHPSSWQRHFENAMVTAGLDVRCQIIWAKNTFAWGHGRYKFQHEPIFYGCVSGQSDKWYGDKTQSTVWSEKASRIHPTAKPIELVERALVNSSKEGDLVVDFFGGSGSTMIACERQGRKAFLTEIDPKYADRIIIRWQEFTGLPAKLLSDGRSFHELAIARRAQAAAADVPPVE